MTNQPHIEPDLSKPKTPMEYLRLYLSGFAMGSADIVPGVSGGTMAFILGIYGTLIDAIKSFNLDVFRSALKFDLKHIFEVVPFRFLISLGLGILSAVFLLASLLEGLLDDEPTFIFAFFAGLILASILAIGMKVKWSPAAMGALLLTAVVAFAITGLREEHTPLENYVNAVRTGTEAEITTAEAALIADLEADEIENPAARVEALGVALRADDGTAKGLEDALEEELYDPSNPLVLFVSGAIAICAMILPGISGSFILLVLGQYAIVLGAVKTFDIVNLVVFTAGCAVGIMAFSRVLSWLLKHQENITIAALVGFMVGSMRKIWVEAEAGVEVVNPSGQLDGGQIVLVIALVLVGFLLVSLLDHMQSRSNPVFAWIWKPGPKVDDVAIKAESMD